MSPSRRATSRSASPSVSAHPVLTDHVLADQDYARLAAFRFALRRFMHFSADAAEKSGLTPHQHQALLSIKGHGGARPITIGQLADHLVVAPHTAAELVARLKDEGLVRKVSDATDRRRVGLRLTARAEASLRRLTRIHLEEVRVMAPGLIDTLDAIMRGRAAPATSGRP